MSDDILSKEKSKHRYSTIALLIIGAVMGFVALVDAIDGFGTKDVLAKFTMGGVIGNSSIVDDLNGSFIYTSDLYDLVKSASTTPNGTKFDPSKSFELQSFALGCSFVSDPSITSFSCADGFSFTTFNLSGSNMWTSACCQFDNTKCQNFTTSNIENISSPTYASYILSSQWNSLGFGMMCCNADMSYCYNNYPAPDGTLRACGAEYNLAITSMSFNNVSNEWYGKVCSNGFK